MCGCPFPNTPSLYLVPHVTHGLYSKEVSRLYEPLIEKHVVTVDYDQSLDQLLIAGGYDGIASCEHGSSVPLSRIDFLSTVEGHVDREMVLVCYGQRMYAEDVRKDLGNRKLRPLTIRELLAYGAAYPEHQELFHIVALGSEVRVGGDNDCVPFLSKVFGRRCVELKSAHYPWDRYCRFGAVLS